MSLATSFAFTDAVFTTGIESLGTTSGQRLPAVPRFSASLAPQYELGLPGGWGGQLAASLRFVGSRPTYVFVAPAAPVTFDEKSYFALDLSARAQHGDWRLGLFAKNLFDRRAYLTKAAFPDAVAGGIVQVNSSLLQPRTIGFSIDRVYLRSHLPKRIYPPGDTPAYSNYATALDGYIVARVSGQPFEEYVDQHILRPLGKVWRPANSSHSLPILLQRSPYGYPPDKVKKSFSSEYRELAHEGFIFVLEDIRGRFGSEGRFVMPRPKAQGPAGVDESTDAFDSIDWLVKHLPANNGAAGVFGVSYMGWTTAMATVNPHPALQAVSVQASPEDMYLGDDFHHNGAFRLQYAWEYVAALESDGRTLQPMNYGKEDPYSWFLKSGQLANLDQRITGHALPSWRNFVDHPDYDAFWRLAVTSTLMPAHPQVPNLIVAGWWDQEDLYGPLTIYQRQEKGDVHDRNFLVIGPWRHGGWMEQKADHYGPFDLGADTATHFRANIETPWFRYWLKHEGTLNQPEALVFETGSNQWKSYDAWPPRAGVVARSLHLHANHGLSFEPPQAEHDGKSDSFVSDPSNPVPYRQRPIEPVVAPDASETSWRTWLSDDQTPLRQPA